MPPLLSFAGPGFRPHSRNQERESQKQQQPLDASKLPASSPALKDGSDVPATPGHGDRGGGGGGKHSNSVEEVAGKQAKKAVVLLINMLLLSLRINSVLCLQIFQNCSAVAV